ncbi:MAG: alpha-glucan family phosphorylase, partial [Candidatus Bathyarchaeota archaeon]
MPTPEVPISYITNGVHAPSWLARKTRELFEKYVGDNWRANHDDPKLWKSLDKIPPEVVWQTKLEIKKKMLNHVKERLEHQFNRNKFGSLQLLRIKQLIRTDALTIGFARRFATYKRGTLLFRDQERLSKILNNPERPVQLIFAGKAHPKDAGGQDLIRQIYNFSLSSEFRGKILFV